MSGVVLTRADRPLCVFPDEINWPDGEEAPPPDSQELIALLLRQNPLERMGAGTKRQRATASNSVRDQTGPAGPAIKLSRDLECHLQQGS